VTIDVNVAIAAARAATAKSLIERALDVLEADGLLATEDGTRVVLGELALRDFHYLRALVVRAGLVPEAARREPCENCGAALVVLACQTFEPGPYVDGELDDPELDAPFDFDAEHELTGASGRDPRKTRLSPRTVDEARRLLVGAGPLALDRSVLAALGVRKLATATRAAEIADVLEGASDAVFGDVLALYEAAHYSPRMVADAFCAACGARTSVPVPSERELDRLAAPDERDASFAAPEGFPTVDAFEVRVRAYADAVLKERGLRNIDVVLDDGVPWVDDGGEPLLGCYTPPGDPDSLAPRPEIRIFYRTFAAEARHDPDFDVEDEIRETLDHEAEHHLHFLEGEDPLDEAERAVIAKERARVVGRAELTRRDVQTFGRDLLGFAKIALPIVLVLVGLSLFRTCVD